MVSSALAQETQVITEGELQRTRMQEEVGDFFFSVKHFFTVDDKKELQLIQERNEELKARQQEWVEIKQEVFAQIENDNIAETEREAIIEEVQAAHEDIVVEHVELIEKADEIKGEATAEGNVEVAMAAESTVEVLQESQIQEGVITDADATAMIEINISVSDDENTSVVDNTTQDMLTPFEAQTLAENEFGFEADSVMTETKDSVEYYVVTGREEETIDGVYTVKEYTVWIDAYSGYITDVSYSTEAESDEGDASVVIEEHVEGSSAEASSETILEVNI